MKLIIVESPTKAKTIESFLKGSYKVVSSYGHVRDLPKSKIGIDIEKDFEPQYIVPVKSKKRVTELKKIALKSEAIILATDEDREGEAIAFHLTQVLNLPDKKTKKSNLPADKPKKFERIVFHEITKEAIEESIKNPREIYMDLVDAQQARRVLDRLVGYNLSPFLWKKVARKLSAGRVQSVALRLIVEREREIKSFNPQEYWVIEAIFSAQGGSASGGSTDNKEELRAILSKIEDKNIEIGQIKNKDESQKIIGDLEKSKFLIENVTKKELKRNPSPPFTTSTLQQAAFARLKFSSKQTMRTAQALYEKGLITYMRTDSVNLSSQSLQGAKEWLKKNLGDEYCLESPRYFKNKSKNAQEAHEAIRPTRSDFEPEKNDFEDAREKKLYDLIWRRFVASQMPQAIFNSTSIDIEGNGDKKYMFKVSGSILKFDGFLKIWPSKFAENEIPEIDKNDKITLKEILPSQHFTEPLPRYNDASLVKTLEELGIGRPSTYASIISVIQERNYIIRNEQKRFEPTEIGEKVNDVLVENFPEVINVQFTAKMEDELDQVAQGKLKWKEIIREFYGPFEKNLKEKYETVKHQAPITETTEEKCEKCGKPMLVRFSRFGKFLGCSGFPECRTIKSLIDPNAHNNSPQKSFGKCPKCQDGEIVRRKTKKGRWFYGCSKYPDCDHASWKKPEGQEIEE